MNSIFISEDKLIKTSDSLKYKKDCSDFICLVDGTITGEYKYCNRSFECQQIGYDIHGKKIQMEAHFLKVVDVITKEVEHELFCTGMLDNRSKNERVDDDGVS